MARSVRGGKQSRPPGSSRLAAKKANGVPEYDPSLRWQELAEEQELDEAQEGAPLAARGARAIASLAELRLKALDDLEAMGPLEETLLTPATLGASNWIELGPTAIPDGQTYGGARVIVT